MTHSYSTDNAYIVNAGDKQSEFLPASLPFSQESRTGTELHTLRKRQSFNFGDNRLQPAMLADQPQTDAQLPAPPISASAAASGAASGAAASLSATPTQAAAHDDPGKGKSSKPPVPRLSVPSMPDGKVRPAMSVASSAATNKVAQQTGQPYATASQMSTTTHAMPSSVSSTRAAAGSSKPAPSKGVAARASHATAPVVTSPPAASHADARSPKPTTPRKPGWQH